MEIVEVVRRWQAGESQRGITRATGLARETVNKHLAAAGTLGLLPNIPPPSEDQAPVPMGVVIASSASKLPAHKLTVAGRVRLGRCYPRGALSTTFRAN